MAGGPLDIVLLGAPGSGKGTQAERIAPAFGLPHVSTGDILRAAVKGGTELGVAAKRFMDAGELVPDEVVIGIIRERLTEPDTTAGFMLDGFPRTLEQATALDETLAGARRSLGLVLLIDVPEEELVQRLAGRRACRSCGRGYNVVFDPPGVEGVCDVCGGELFQRDDDNEATVRNRLAVYRRQTEPLIGYYRGKGILSTVYGGGRNPDQVFADVETLLGDARRA
ncbi:MAG: adenylate kinase [Thermoleophilia bacterium]|jgi:adenylate kinase